MNENLMPNQKPPVDVKDVDLLPWPGRKHDLLAAGADWRAHAVLDYQHGRGWGRLYGYRRAAQVLAERMVADASDLDVLVFPFAACWRHHVELRLKDLLKDLRRLLDVEADAPHHHDVVQLWNETRPLLVEAHPGEERRDRSVVTRLLRQLGALDPGGQDFRYAQRQDGTPSLTGVDRLDVRAFHEAMEAVATYLEAASEQTAYALDMKEDYEEEMRQQEQEMRREYEQEMRREYDGD